MLSLPVVIPVLTGNCSQGPCRTGWGEMPSNVVTSLCNMLMLVFLGKMSFQCISKTNASVAQSLLQDLSARVEPTYSRVAIVLY